MIAANKILSAVYQKLNADERLAGKVFVGSRKEKGQPNPVLLIFVRDGFQDTSVERLHNVFIDFVARSNAMDGEGSELEAIFQAADELVDGEHFTRDNASGTLRRRGLPVMGAIFDDVEQDYAKRWRYHAIVKSN